MLAALRPILIKKKGQGHVAVPCPAVLMSSYLAKTESS